MIKIRKGLDLPIAGEPEQEIEDARPVRSVALLGRDYPGMKPTMVVNEGDSVVKGQLLFTDKKTAGVEFVAPASGRVSSINRGAKRVFISLVIDVEDEEQGSERGFNAYSKEDIVGLDADTIKQQLVQSGSWTALRTRPYSKIPSPDSSPRAIFVTAIDTNPLAADANVVINAHRDLFLTGVRLLSVLTEGQVHVCGNQGSDPYDVAGDQVQYHAFQGSHPAGLPGTHIHFVDPVSANKTVWFIGYQDVIAIGHLFLHGSIMTERVVSLAGPGVERPRLLRTRLGANLEELTAGELVQGEQRIISGSVLAGNTAIGQRAFLGRYHQQVSVVTEDRERKVLGYLRPGANRHSVFPAFLSKWIGEKTVSFTTSTNGSTRAMVPIGTYDAVIPMDILATQLMRSLLVGDVEKAIELGCLELDEEDVALCTYVCPGKYEYGPVLRDMLTQIEKEG